MSSTRIISDAKKNKADSKLKIQQQFCIDMASGLLSGTFCSGLFNPWDRALYLSVKYARPFLSWENFTSPYQGFSQTIVQRAFLGSVYYVVQGQMKYNIHPYLRNHLGISESSAQFCIGITAGSMSGILTNSISAIKYHTWGEDSRTFFSSIHEMWTLGRVKPFLKGTQATVARDATFGCTYEILRTIMGNQILNFGDKKNDRKYCQDFLCNSTAAGLATIASGPFNYARTMQYATPPNENPPTTGSALKDVWHESKNQSKQFMGRIRFFQKKFRIGWGTARVAAGMAVGQKVFDITRLQFSTNKRKYMIIAYSSENKLKAETITIDNQKTLDNAIWIDLVNPVREEEILVEKTIGLDIPTREEMQEIELSSRLYKENDVLFMTVTMVAKSDSSQPKSDAVTLILTKKKLITIRYIEPHSFALFISHLTKLPVESHNATALLVELLDTAIDRLADILENVSSFLDGYSQTIFHPKSNGEPSEKTDYKNIIQGIGASGDLNTKVQESLITFNRLISFFGKNISDGPNLEIMSKLTLLNKDIKSLNDHVNFISNKVIFLLDATLGMVSIEQNNIIKIFSIAAVILLPPTLIASMYGMNFDFIPELKWRFGYPFAIVLMLISAWIPYKYFKMKKWL